MPESAGGARLMAALAAGVVLTAVAGAGASLARAGSSGGLAPPVVAGAGGTSAFALGARPAGESRIVAAGAGGISADGQAEEGGGPLRTAQGAGGDHLRIELRTGPVIVRMRPDLAPLHVARMLELAESGFYDGIVFHRVIEGFMAQTGDPTGTGRGGSGRNLRAEFSQEPFIRGTVGMARSQHPDSADSQFFICFADARFLDGQYTVVGEVVEGMEHVDRIKLGDRARNGVVTDPDRMLSVRPVARNGGP